MENMKPILWPPAARSALGRTEGGRVRKSLDSKSEYQEKEKVTLAREPESPSTYF